MKKILSLICLCLVTNVLFAQYYYYYYDKQIPVSLNTGNIYIATTSAANVSELKNIIGDNYEIVLAGIDKILDALNLFNAAKNLEPKILRAEIKLKNIITETEYLNLVEQLKQLPSVCYAAPCFLNGTGGKVDISHLFYVKLQSKADLNELQAMAQQTKTILLGEAKYLPNWYVLRCDNNSAGNTMELANRFYESGKFITAEPDFFNNTISNSDCSTTGGSGSDTYFSDQWGLQNTGQNDGTATGTAGIDINACPAWGITTGSSSVVVAVIDDNQFYSDHPDFANVGTGYSADGDYFTNSETGTGSLHATNCAGIIAAVQNNSAGISGVAPGATIVPVAKQLDAMDLNKGYCFVKPDSLLNVSVFSCSWGLTTSSSVVADAIEDALTNGRGGRGCVIIFSAGNSNNDINEWPQTTGFNLIVVGAIDRQGSRAGQIASVSTACEDWCSGSGCDPGSCFGSQLSVVAPGAHIYTTNSNTTSNTYTSNFAGTSAAAPFVAGVAALILAANPCLSGQAVKKSIEQTAQKIRSDLYSYSNDGTHLNGTWSNDLGYGLVDAYSAISYASTSYLQNNVETGTTTKDNLGNVYVGAAVDPNLITGNYVISSSANITIKSPTNIYFEPGFIADAGGQLDAFISPFTGDCAPWTPIFKMDEINSEKEPSKNNSTNSFTSVEQTPILVYPNPFTSDIQIKFTTVLESSSVNISICDIAGRLVYEDNKKVNSGNHNYSIPLNIPAAVYLIKVYVNNDFIIDKIIKI